MTIVAALAICGLIWYALIRAIKMIEPDGSIVSGKRTGRSCGSER